MVASRLIGSKRPSVSRQPVQRGCHQGVSGLYGVQQIIQARSLHHGPCDDVLVDMGDASAGEAHPLVLQRVSSVVPAAAYAGATIDCRIFYLARAGCRKTGSNDTPGLLVFPLPPGEGTFPTIERPSHRPPPALRQVQQPKSAGPGGDGPGRWQFALPSDFPLLKGGMHFGGCHCHAPSELETSNTGRLRSCDYSAERRPAYIKSGKFSLRTHTALKTRESIRC